MEAGAGVQSVEHQDVLLAANVPEVGYLCFCILYLYLFLYLRHAKFADVFFVFLYLYFGTARCPANCKFGREVGHHPQCICFDLFLLYEHRVWQKIL